MAKMRLVEKKQKQLLSKAIHYIIIRILKAKHLKTQ